MRHEISQPPLIVSFGAEAQGLNGCSVVSAIIGRPKSWPDKADTFVIDTFVTANRLGRYARFFGRPELHWGPIWVGPRDCS